MPGLWPFGVEPIDMRKGFDGLYGFNAGSPGRGSTERIFVLHESASNPAESIILRRQQPVGVRQAPRARALLLASAECDDGPEELAMFVSGLDLTAARPRRHWLRGGPTAQQISGPRRGKDSI